MVIAQVLYNEFYNTYFSKVYNIHFRKALLIMKGMRFFKNSRVLKIYLVVPQRFRNIDPFLEDQTHQFTLVMDFLDLESEDMLIVSQVPHKSTPGN